MPIYFDPDVEKRGLASLGLAQRNYAELNDWMKGAWQHLHGKMAQQFNHSPKWLMVGQALASQENRLWTYHEIDTLIIYLWPLLKLHNWTYCDLMNVIRSLRSPSQPSTTIPQLRPDRPHRSNPQPSTKAPQLPPASYPCTCDRDFANYCLTILGLRKTRRGKTTPGGRPPGYDVAMRLFQRPPPS